MIQIIYLDRKSLTWSLHNLYFGLPKGDQLIKLYEKKWDFVKLA